MQLTAEQELYIRQTMARRVKTLERADRITGHDNNFDDGWNEALTEAVKVVMGGDPLHYPANPNRCDTSGACDKNHTYGPGCLLILGAYVDSCADMPRDRLEFGKRKDGSYAPVLTGPDLGDWDGPEGTEKGS